MIVAAIEAARSSSREPVAVFDAIVRVHTADADEYRVITQPDHAKVSGQIASVLDRQRFPFLNDELVQAIALHDAGWKGFDGAAPEPILPPIEDGRLRSFVTTPPEMFLQAWVGSIAAAEAIHAVAGTMVSRHFCRLAQFRLQQTPDPPEIAARLKEFLLSEAERQARLTGTEEYPKQDSAPILEVLQFCDLASLYACCGLQDTVELPFELGAGPIRIRREGEKISISGVPMQRPLQTECPAYVWKRGSSELRSSPLKIEFIPAD